MTRNRTIRYLLTAVQNSSRLSPLQKEIIIARLKNIPFRDLNTLGYSEKKLQHEELVGLHKWLGILVTKSGNLLE